MAGSVLAVLALSLAVVKDAHRSTQVEAAYEQPTDAAVRDALTALEGADPEYEAWRANERAGKYQAPYNAHAPRDAFLNSGVSCTREEVCSVLGAADLVIVPDFHDVPLGRIALTRLVRMLTDTAGGAGRPRPAGLCLEAFRACNQPDLDRATKLPRAQVTESLMKLLEASWPFPILEYEGLLSLCLDQGIPIVGAGVPEAAVAPEALLARLLVSPCEDILRTPAAQMEADDPDDMEGSTTRMSRATMQVILQHVHDARREGREGPFFLVIGAGHVFEWRTSVCDLARDLGLRAEVAVLDTPYWKRRLRDLRGAAVADAPLSFEAARIWWLPLVSSQEVVEFVEKHREQLARRDELRQRK